MKASNIYLIEKKKSQVELFYYNYFEIYLIRKRYIQEELVFGNFYRNSFLK